MDQEQEVRIIQQVRDGDAERYALVVDAYKDRIFTLAFRMTGSRQDAQDLAQEIFVRAFRALGGFDVSRPFYPWLYTIGLNVVRRHLKRRGLQRERMSGLETSSGLEAGPEAMLIEKQHGVLLQQALLGLGAIYREALVLRFVQGLSYGDMAGILGISVSGAKMRVRRGLEDLQGLLPEGLEPRSYHG